MGLEELLMDQGWATVIGAALGACAAVIVQWLAKKGVVGILGEHQQKSTEEHGELSDKLLSGNNALSDKLLSGNNALSDKLLSGNNALSDKLLSGNNALSDKLTASNINLSDKIHDVHTIVVTDKEISEKNYQSLDEKQKDIKDSLGKINDIMHELEKVNAKNLELSLKVDNLKNILTVEKQRNVELNKNIENLVADKSKLLNDIDNLKNDRDKDFTMER